MNGTGGRKEKGVIKGPQWCLIINGAMMKTVFDDGFMKEAAYLWFLSQQKTGKEGDETKMKRVKGGEEVCLLSGDANIKLAKRRK